MLKKFDAAFLGLSHLGIVTSVCWTSLGKKVVAIDTREDLIKKLAAGNLTLTEGEFELQEPGLLELFQHNKKNYHPTQDFNLLKKIDLVFFAQDTPTDGKGDTKKLDELISRALPFLKQNVTIIIMSQVPPGFCRKIYKKILERRKTLKFNLFHWVDTVVMTQAVDRFLKPERIILGTAKLEAKLPAILKKSLKSFNTPLFLMSLESAEITKAAINLYLATSVTFANTLSDYCEVFGASIFDIIPALRSDKRIGPYAYLRPTLRIAGGHLERDLTMLNKISRYKKISPGIVSFILNTNNKRYKWAINKLKAVCKNKNSKICLWGLAYKKDSTSTHNASSLKIIEELNNRSILTAYDPMAILPADIKRITRFDDKYEAVRGTDCLIITTEWDEFGQIEVGKLGQAMRGKTIIDCVGILYPRRKELANFNYISMGVGK